MLNGIPSSEELERLLSSSLAGLRGGSPEEIREFLEQQMEHRVEEHQKKYLDWWSKYSFEFDNLDPLDPIVYSMSFPVKFTEIELAPVIKQGLVIDEVTMRDLKLMDLVDSMDNTQTQAGRRMLEYAVHFPLKDKAHIEKRQDAIRELTENPDLTLSLLKYFNMMKENEDNFVRFVYPSRGRDSPSQNQFKQARDYLSYMPQLIALLKGVKSDRLGEIRENMTRVLSKEKVRRLYDSVVDGSTDVDIMKLHPATWSRSVSDNVINTLKIVGPIMKALSDGHIKADLTTGEFRITPRKDGDPINIQYPLGLSLDLGELRDHYFDQNALFNLYYSSGSLEALCSIAMSGIKLGNDVKMVFPKLSQNGRFDCNFQNPADIYFLTKQGKFVPNSYCFDGDKRGVVITGPNSGGKTVYGFTLPRLQVLTQIGSQIPAQSAETTVADYIFTLRPASKEQVGEGRYLHSLVRGREMFERATANSLIAIDDFEGTDPEDCYKESMVMLKHLGLVGSAFTMTTQDRRVANEIEKNEGNNYNGVSNVQMRCDINNGKGQVMFHYTVIPGIGKSIGEACARSAGMDEESLRSLLRGRDYIPTH